MLPGHEKKFVAWLGRVSKWVVLAMSNGAA